MNTRRSARVVFLVIWAVIMIGLSAAVFNEAAYVFVREHFWVFFGLAVLAILISPFMLPSRKAWSELKGLERDSEARKREA